MITKLALFHALLLVLTVFAWNALCLVKLKTQILGEVGKDQLALLPEYSPNKYEDRRLLDIDSVFNGSQLAGKRVLVTGANHGLGPALVQQLAQSGALVAATCRESSKELDASLAAGTQKIFSGLDVRSDPEVAAMAAKVNGSIDIIVNNVGYDYAGNETLDKLNAKEDLLMFDIDAEGPLRVTKALRAAGKLQNGSKVVTISSQGGSVTWMSEFARRGWPSQDYGYHMSKAASNRGMAVLAGELKPEGITVIALHPGFVKTDMTARFSEAYETGGAVDIDTAAKRVLHQANVASMRTTGSFLNCEDGLLIPW
mmetsp:Transcript_109203/g.198987  ORF Transcript_109203/g.198987 Transcript_109203/m.198987 type:complete len:313 (-) Transcript_109203:128-1066(-)